MIHEICSQFDAWLSIREDGRAFNRQAGLAAAKLLEHVADAALSEEINPRHIFLTADEPEANATAQQQDEPR